MKIDGDRREFCEATEFVANPPHPSTDHARTSEIKLSISQIKDRRYVTAALMLVMTLASMEMTVTSTAMPTIIGDLHGLEHYSWVASLYLLTSTVSMPLYGRLADKFGRKYVIIAAISIFTGASMLAATSQGMMQLILFRGLQGLGAGGIMPVVLTILSDIFTLKERASVQGLFSVIWGTAAMGGPALGAILVNTLGWRSVFYVNLPLGLLGLAVLIWKYHEHEEPHPTDLDLPGVFSLAIACAAILAMVTRLGIDGSSWMTPSLLGVAIVAIIYFIRHERQAPHPIMPASLLFRRAIGPALAGSFLLGLGYLCIDVYVPLYVQGGRGGGATAAASAITPVVLTWSIANAFAAPLLIRWGFRKTSLVSSILIALGMTGLLVSSMLAVPHWVLTMTLSITGLGLGPASLCFLLAPQEAVSWQQRGNITSSVMFFRTIGGAVGVGLLGALFNLLIASDFARLQRLGIKPSEVFSPELHSKLSPELLASGQHAIVNALTWVFAVMLFFSLVQIAVATLMPAFKPQHEIKRSEEFEAA